ncbi:30S ribosomal protein S8 [Candidatus Woesearchaeota archaeon]|nr:30S ribosomal protein S8 [Candidatus Woesearchaeota archaeon]
MLNDPLANALSHIMNNEKAGKSSCIVSPCSKVVKKVLDLLNAEGYIGKYEEVTPAKGGVIKVNLIGGINNCGVVKPLFSVKKDSYEKFEKRFLLAEDFGIMIVSTNQGIMTHEEAKKKGLGGKIIAFCY